jgi:hypothetical protein
MRLMMNKARITFLNFEIWTFLSVLVAFMPSPAF